MAALLGLAGIVLALHVLQVDDSLPAIGKLPGQGWFPHSVSRAFFVRATLVDALLLPVTCWFFAAVAHAGRIEIDMFSWLFVLVFYLALWWLGFEVDHVYVYQINNRQAGGVILPTGTIANPLGLWAGAVVIGSMFWRWKQEGKLWVR